MVPLFNSFIAASRLASSCTLSNFDNISSGIALSIENPILYNTANLNKCIFALLYSVDPTGCTNALCIWLFWGNILLPTCKALFVIANPYLK